MGDEDDDAGAADAGGMNVTKYNVMPSLVSLMQMRNRLHLAFLGRKLMKWTALATGKELRRLSVEMGGLLTDFIQEFKEAFMMLARCRYFIPDFNTVIVESITENAGVTVKSTARSVAGVKVRTITLIELVSDTYAYVGIGRGGEIVKAARDAWLALLRLMVALVQFRDTFDLIDIANKNATKKQNVLQRCIIPKIILTMRYIMSELDEQEREESFRLKRFKQLKYKNVAPAKPFDEEATVPVKKVPEVVPEKPKKEPAPKPVAPKPAVKVVVPPAPPPPPPPPPPPKPAPPPVVKPVPVPVPKPITPPPVSPPKSSSEENIEPPKEEDDLITQIKKVVNLAEQLELAGIPPSDYGFSNCDVARLKAELRRVIELHEEPDRKKLCLTCEDVGRVVSACVCDDMVTGTCPSCDGRAKTAKKEPGPPASKPASKPAAKDAKAPPQEPSIPSRLDELEKHVDKVICMTNFYRSEGLLSKSAEDFLKCCQSVKQRIRKFKEQKKIKAKLETLKEQVTSLENITDLAQREELSSTTISSFMSCCRDFKDKLSGQKTSKGAPSVCSVEKLLGQIDDSITLTNEAKKVGLVSESVEKFIECCEEIKSKIEPSNEQNPEVIENLLLKVNHIIEFIKKYKADGLISESIEKFYKTCENTKAKLECYKECKKRPALSCNKSTSPKTVPPPPPKPPCKCGHSVSGHSCGTKPEPVRETIETACGSFPSKEKKTPTPNPCKARCSLHYNPPCPESNEPGDTSDDVCGPKSVNKHVCGTDKSQSSKDSVCTTCSQKSTSKKSRDTSKTHSSKDSVCSCYQKSLSQKTADSGKTESSQGSNLTCTASTCAHKPATKEPEGTCKTQSCPHFKPPPEPVIAEPSKESTFTCTCSMKSSKSQDCCKSQSCPHFKTPDSKISQDSASTCGSKPKPVKTEVEQNCKSKTCSLSKSALSKTVSLKREAEKKTHECCKPKASHESVCSCKPTVQNQKSHGSSKSSKDSAVTCTGSTCMHEPASKDSNCNANYVCLKPTEHKSHESSKRVSKSASGQRLAGDISAKKSKSSDSVKMVVPINIEKPKPGFFHKTVSTMTSVRRYKGKDGTVVEETETVTLQQRIIDPKKVPSHTQLSATSLCSGESAKHTMEVNLCAIPMKKGFIKTVRNVQSETLIRSMDLSYSNLPIVWSSISADTLNLRGRNNASQTVQQDSLATNHDDVVSILSL